MPLPSSRFVESPSIQNLFRDKDTGLPLSGGIVTWYSDVSRTTLKPIYQQVRLPDNTYEFVELNNPLTLSSTGTFADDNGNDINVYTYPYTGLPTDAFQGGIELYYVTVESSDHVLNEIREAWPPNVTSGGQVRSFQSPTNELSNPQFSVVSFYPTSGYTFSVSAAGEVTNIAPDWDIVTTGTGTITVSQVPVTDTSAPSHPPYAIQISSTGITSLHLRQRLRVTSRLLLNGFISGTFVAQAMANPPAIISMNYMPSTSSTPTLFQQICEGTATVGSYSTIANNEAVEIGLINSDSAPNGYVDIYLDIPPSSNVQISSVQIVAVENKDSSTSYMQQSNEREIDHLFHYYNLPLQQKPIDSYLVGWDFAMNPAQLGSTFGAQAIGANKSFYCWDQTIVFQSANSGVTVARESSANLLNLTAAVTGQMALVQYLSAEQAKKVLFQLVYGGSVNVSIACSTGAVNCMATLWWSASPVGTGMTTNDSLISGLAADGLPTVTAGWNEISRTNAKRATFPVSSSSLTDFGFSGFAAASAYSTGVSFAIVLSTGSIPSGTILTIASISLVSGDIPTRPAYKSYDDTLRECQYYYEKSYSPGTSPGTVTSEGQRYALNELGSRLIGSTATTDTVYLQSFSLVYDQIKRSIVTPSFYSPGSASIGLVRGFVARNGAAVVPSGAGAVGSSPANYPIANWTITGASKKGCVLLCADTSTKVYDSGAGTPGADGDESMMLYHYVADARLGIVA